MTMHGVPQGVSAPPRSAASEEEAGPDHGLGGKTPGTLLLVFVFLLAFVLYYFVNWKLLSFVWQIG